MIKIYNECCLQGMPKIPEKSVDLILVDLPYGTTVIGWDKIIDMERMWGEFKRIIKTYGNIVLFAKQPFSSKLVSTNYEMFRYSLVWKKNRAGGFVFAPYKPLSEHEDILVFSRARFTCNSKHRMVYNPQGTKDCYIKQKGKNSAKTPFCPNKKRQPDYIQKKTNYPRSVLEFDGVYKPFHPTQKPLDLVEYLIRTYSNENDMVMDCCLGSGTTAVASKNTNRNFIGFELSKKYYEHILKRLDADENRNEEELTC